MKPQDYLQELQAAADEEWGVSAPDFGLRVSGLRQEMIERLPAELRERARGLMKQFPDLAARSSLLAITIREEIKELLPEADWGRVQDVPIGILNSAEFNGFAVRVPGGGSIAVLNAGLLGILHGVNKTLMKLTVAEKGDGEPDIAEMESLVNTLPAFARSVITLNRCKPPRPVQVGRGQFTIANLYTNMQELFCFAHEYGHILLGHLGATDKNTEVLGQKKPVDVYRRSRDDELAADMQAGAILLHSHHGDPNMQAVGLVILFNLLSLCERLTNRIPRIQNTHPSAKERKEALLRFYASHLHKGGTDLIRKMDMLFDMSMMT